MRDFVVFAVVMGCLPTAFRRPFIGLLLFSWLAYMRPQDLCWSFARGMRFSFYVGLVMVAGWFVNESQVRKFWRLDIRTGLIVALVIVTTVSLSIAQRSFGDTYVARYFFEFIKIVVVALFTTGQVDTKRRLRVLLWTICGCLAFYGVKGGVIGVLTGGSPILRGPGGMLEDNNDFALALTMNIPLLFYLGRTEEKVWVRRLTDLGVVLTLITILLTHSRGGFLAATATLLVMAWRSRRLVQAAGVMALTAVMFFAFAPDHVIERIASIGQGSADSSANARLQAWAAAFRMIEDSPFLGVGMRNFQYQFSSVDGVEAGQQMAYVAHNSYLQIWAETGTPGFLIYMVMLGSVFWACGHVRRLARLRPDLKWIRNYALMFEATTVGFMVGAVFLNRGHFDLIYHWLALTSCMVWVARREVALMPEAAVNAEPQGRVEVRWQARAEPMRGGRLMPRWGR